MIFLWSFSSNMFNPVRNYILTITQVDHRRTCNKSCSAMYLAGLLSYTHIHSTYMLLQVYVYEYRIYFTCLKAILLVFILIRSFPSIVLTNLQQQKYHIITCAYTVTTVSVWIMHRTCTIWHRLSVILEYWYLGHLHRVPRESFVSIQWLHLPFHDHFSMNSKV